MLIERIAARGEATFEPPVDPEALRRAEARLGHPLPDDLGQLLAESDGVDGEQGLGLVWSLDRITMHNTAFRTKVEFRELYMRFDGHEPTAAEIVDRALSYRRIEL